MSYVGAQTLDLALWDMLQLFPVAYARKYGFK
jgi:hypothetical protein